MARSTKSTTSTSRKGKSEPTERKFTQLFFELGMMKKIEHCGTKFAGHKNPDSIGEHSCRAAQIGYILAVQAGLNAEHVAAMCSFHDMGEVRIGDMHRIASRYVDTLSAERAAVIDQTLPLGTKVARHVLALWDEFHDQKTPESHLARDADLLETMFEAKELQDKGMRAAKRWLENGSRSLKTAIAKKVYTALTKTEFTEWWDRLNTVE